MQYVIKQETVDEPLIDLPVGSMVVSAEFCGTYHLNVGTVNEETLEKWTITWLEPAP
jgi:hypothetical protein